MMRRAVGIVAATAVAMLAGCRPADGWRPEDHNWPRLWPGQVVVVDIPGRDPENGQRAVAATMTVNWDDDPECGLIDQGTRLRVIEDGGPVRAWNRLVEVERLEGRCTGARGKIRREFLWPELGR